MKEAIRRVNPAAEAPIPEGCRILELSNSDDDDAVSVARARLAPGGVTRWHRLHGIAERYLLLQGRGRVEVGTLPAQEVRAGDVVLIPPGVPQRIANAGSDDLLFAAICSPRFHWAAYEDLGDGPQPAVPVASAAAPAGGIEAAAAGAAGIERALARWHAFVAGGDVAQLDAMLADDVVFHSPVVHRPQAGRAITTQYLRAALLAFGSPSFRYVLQVVGERDAVLEFTVELDGIQVNGVDMLRVDDAGRVVEFKVMLRPLKAVNLIHARMGALLQAGQAGAAPAA